MWTLPSPTPPEAIATTSAARPLLGRRFVTHNFLVASGVVLSGLLGFVFQAAISHRLHPAEYGGAFALISLLMLLGPPSNAVALLVARETSHGIAAGDRAAADGLVWHGMRVALLVGSGLAVFVLLASPVISGFLHVPIGWVWVGAIGAPFRVATPVLSGVLQGEQRFSASAALAVGDALFRLLIAVVLAVFLGGFGVIAGTALAGMATFAVLWALAWRRTAAEVPVPNWRGAVGYILRVAPATLCFTSMFTLDVVLVKHYIPGQRAGEYAAVAALGRSAYWVGLGINQVLFPKVVSQEARSRRSHGLALASLGLIFAVGLASLGVFWAGARPLMELFAGSRYVRGAAYLWWYGLAMVLLGAAMVFVTIQQSRGRIGFLWILVPVTLLEPILIVVNHPDPMRVAQVVTACTALLLVGLAAMHGRPSWLHPAPAALAR